jgi:hypothetical protein
MHFLLRALSAVFFISCFSCASGQQHGELVKASQSPEFPFTVTRFGMEHGLPQNQVNAIIELKNGCLVIATSNGIVQYNGAEFRNYARDKNYHGHPHYQLFFDEHTQRLYGTELIRSFNVISPEYKQLASLVSAAMSDGHFYGIDVTGDIWSRPVSGGNFRIVYRSGIANPFTLFKDEKEMFVSDYHNLYRIDLEKKTKSLVVPRPFHKIARNPFDGKIYAVGMQTPYVLRLDGGRAEYLPLPDSRGSYAMSDILFVSKDLFYVTTFAGLIEYRNGVPRMFGKEMGIPEQLLTMHYSRKDNCLFLGTVQQGLFRLQYKSCLSYSDLGEGYIPSVISIVPGKDEVIGISSERLFLSLKNGKVSKLGDVGLYLSSASAIGGYIYCGTWGSGIAVCKGAKLVQQVLSKELNGIGARAVFRDSRGFIWIGHQKGVTIGKSTDNMKALLPGKLDSEINYFYELADGTICAAGSGGIFFIDRAHRLIKQLGKKNGLYCREVRSFCEDGPRLWIGTYGGGMYCLENERLTPLSRRKNYLLGDEIFVMQPDGRNNLLITSNSGLRRISLKALRDFYTGKSDFLVPFYFGNASGILNTEFNGGTESNAVRSGADKFVFSNIEGFVEFSNPRYRFRKLTPQIDQVWLNDTLSAPGDHVFERSVKTIRFHFQCPVFNPEYNMYYQYRLSGPGLSDEWSKPQKNDEIAFTFLPPGEYALSVRVIDAFNDPSPVTVSYAFEVEPYFYEAAWFRLAAVLLVLTGVALIMRYRYLKIISKKNAENAIGNTILELKLKAIQSKMDPHFIFNALNNIIYLLDSQKYGEAEVLLQDFSLLIRRFLEHSDYTFLSLGEELDIIELYLSIERKRYNGGFDYRIVCTDEARRALIPTLLIQPLVENAVKHGISHTNRKCNITVSALLTDGILDLTVEDDGIGRERSGMINMSRKKHISKGLGLVEDKIQIMRQKYSLDIKFSITDICGENKTGTIARLIIPVHDKMPDS